MGRTPIRSVLWFIIVLPFLNSLLYTAFFPQHTIYPLIDVEKRDLPAHLRYLHSADEALLQKDYKSARADYFKYLTYAPVGEKSLAWDDLGYIYLMTGNPEKAKTFLEDAVNAAAHDFNSRFYLAVVDLLLDDFTAAASHIEAIHSNVYFDDTWLKAAAGKNVTKENGALIPQADLDLLVPEKGVLLQRSSGQEEGSSTILFLDAFDERNIPIYFVIRGVLLREQGRESESGSSFRSAVEQSPNPHILSPFLEKISALPSAQNLSGTHEETVKVLSGLPDRISHTFDDHPTNVLWKFDRDFLKELRKGRLQEAENILRQGLILNEKSFSINHNLALLLYDHGDLDTAAHYAARTVFFHPDSVEALDLLGNILYRKRDFALAQDYLLRALRLEPDNLFCLYTCGACSYYLEETDSAEKYWTRVIHHAPGQPETNTSKIEEHMLSHEMTVRSRTVLFLSLKAMGSLCLEQDRFQEAAGYLRKAYSLRPEDPDIMFFLGKALACIEEAQPPESIREAISLLEKHMTLEGKHSSEAALLLTLLREKKKPPLT